MLIYCVKLDHALYSIYYVKLIPIVKVYQAFIYNIMTLYIHVGPFTCLALYETAMDEVRASIVEMG